MLFRRLLIILTVFLTATFAQRREIDPEIKGYKLTMPKIRAYDVVVHKLYAATKADPALKTSFKTAGTKKTLNDMVAAVESNPKMLTVIQSSGLNAREFCVLPMGIMSAGTAYMIQTQYKKDASNTANADNIAFYGANRDEIEKLTKTWTASDDQ